MLSARQYIIHRAFTLRRPPLDEAPLPLRLLYQVGQEGLNSPCEARINITGAHRKSPVVNAVRFHGNRSITNGNGQGMFLMRSGAQVSVKLCVKLTEI